MQGYRSWCRSKAHMHLNSNFDRISYRFRDINAFCSKIASILTQPMFEAPSGGTPRDINVLLESTFNGL